VDVGGEGSESGHFSDPFHHLGGFRGYDSVVTRRLFIFDSPDRFIAAAVGEPGHRSFFLQAREGGAVVTLGLEKMQVAALAQRIGELLLATDELSTSPDPDGDVVEPTTELFGVGLLAIAWDEERSHLTVEARPIDEAGEYLETADDDPDGPDLLRVHLSPEQGLVFVRTVASLVAAGRPTCPYCGEPLDPSGHFCARANSQLN
jgi:uncharacterized repeat protein (TIGR03847 family)